MELKLDKEQMDKVLHEAILQTIGESGRELIIKQAVEYLTKETDGYGGRKGPSPLRSAMNESAREVAKAIVKEQLENDDEFHQKVIELLSDAVKEFFSEGMREKVVGRITNAMYDAFNKEY